MGKATQADVAKRAYAIWEREGRPDGRDFDHWLAAERELEATTDRPGEQRPMAAGATATPIKRKPPRAPTRKSR